MKKNVEISADVMVFLEQHIANIRPEKVGITMQCSCGWQQPVRNKAAGRKAYLAHLTIEAKKAADAAEAAENGGL